MKATKMPNFACVWYFPYVNAREVLNKDIVNPIEARKPSSKRLRSSLTGHQLASITGLRVETVIRALKKSKSKINLKSETRKFTFNVKLFLKVRCHKTIKFEYRKKHSSNTINQI